MSARHRAIVAIALTALVACGRKGPGDLAPSSNQHAVEPSCGVPGQPDCPLQGWMKANARYALESADFARLEHAFQRIAELAPAAYAKWPATATRGADAARGGDVAGARSACRECHDTYRTAYRNEMRSRPLPP